MFLFWSAAAWRRFRLFLVHTQLPIKLSTSNQAVSPTKQFLARWTAANMGQSAASLAPLSPIPRSHSTSNQAVNFQSSCFTDQAISRQVDRRERGPKRCQPGAAFACSSFTLNFQSSCFTDQAISRQVDRREHGPKRCQASALQMFTASARKHPLPRQHCLLLSPVTSVRWRCILCGLCRVCRSAATAR